MVQASTEIVLRNSAQTHANIHFHSPPDVWQREYVTRDSSGFFLLDLIKISTLPHRHPFSSNRIRRSRISSLNHSNYALLHHRSFVPEPDAMVRNLSRLCSSVLGLRRVAIVAPRLRHFPSTSQHQGKGDPPPFDHYCIPPTTSKCSKAVGTSCRPPLEGPKAINASSSPVGGI